MNLNAEKNKDSPIRQYINRKRKNVRWQCIAGVEGANYTSPHELEFERQLLEEGIDFERETKIVPGRKFRADFTVSKKGKKIALEVQGGTGWAQIRKGRSSAHKSPDGLLRDYEKSFLAQMNGWMLISVTGEMVWSGKAMEWLKLALYGEQNGQ